MNLVLKSRGCVCELNGVTRKKLYSFIAKRDGEYCSCCGVLSHERQLVVDHKDNNNKNNDYENLQLLCRTCNYLKNPRPENFGVSENIEINHESELETNRKKEPQFRKYVSHQINERNQVPWKDLMFSGAEIHSLSPATVERYLRKLTSPAGIFQTRLIGNTEVVEYKDELPDV